MIGSATFSFTAGRSARLEIARENLAETVADLNVTRDLLATAFHRAEASDTDGMDGIAQVIDGLIGALDRIIERVDLHHE